MSKAAEKTCSLCHLTSGAEGDDVIFFGDWLTRGSLTVHYFCLLLSTCLPQKGKDNNGILGFLVRDIQQEIAAAANRKCIYCSHPYASISCDRCQAYFHVICGHTNYCLFEFANEFKSYCGNCLPIDRLQENLKTPLNKHHRYSCYICTQNMVSYHPIRWIHAKCCGTGFVHSVCMKKYALNAGYYLRCIWCKNEKFREMVKLQGIFVPDRDANWERERGAFQDLHRGHQRCDAERCLCPRGRYYITNAKWSLIKCVLCGSFAIHNPGCLPNPNQSKIKVFKCETCAATERTITHDTSIREYDKTMNTSLYIQKDNSQQLPHSESGNFDDSRNSNELEEQNQCDRVSSSDNCNTSVETVIHIPSQLTNTSNNKRKIDGENELSSEICPNIDYEIVDKEICKNSDLEDIDITLEPLSNLIYLKFYEFRENECLDKVIVGIDPAHPRFANKTLNEIITSTDLITSDDIVKRTSDLNILNEFDKIIDANI